MQSHNSRKKYYQSPEMGEQLAHLDPALEEQKVMEGI